MEEEDGFDAGGWRWSPVALMPCTSTMRTRSRSRSTEQEQEQQVGEAAAVPAGEAPAQEAGAPSSDDMSRLTELKGLLDSGVLTQAEFDAEKHKILGI